MSRQTIVERAKVLQSEIDMLLRNKLTHPKMIISLLRSKKISDDELLKMQGYIEESIQLVKDKITKFITELEHDDK